MDIACIVKELCRCLISGHETDEDGGEVGIKGKEAPCEGRGRHLDPSLIRCVDLQVVAVGGVETEKASTLVCVGVHGVSELLTKTLQGKEMRDKISDKMREREGDRDSKGDSEGEEE